MLMLPKRIKPELCCSNRPARYAMHMPYFVRSCAAIGGKPALLATNGRVLAIFAVQADTEDVDGPVPVVALQVARMLQKPDDTYRDEDGDEYTDEAPPLAIALGKDEVEIYQTRTGTAHKPWLAKFPRPDGEFPKIEHVVRAPDQETKVLGLNTKYLRELADAFGTEEFAIELTSSGADAASRDARRIRTPDGALLGVVMPITWE